MEYRNCNKSNTDSFRQNFKSIVYNYMKDNKYGYIKASCGAGKTLTSFLAICDLYEPSDVVFVTSKIAIFTNLINKDSNRNLICKTKYGNKWLSVFNRNDINNTNQPYFIYNTIASMYNKTNDIYKNKGDMLKDFLRNKKLLFFDECTYSGAKNFVKVSWFIKNNLKDLKIIGASLFDRRPMDGFDDTFIKDYYETCICDFSIKELQELGVLPVVKVLNAHQSSEELFNSKIINPHTGKCYTMSECRDLISHHGLTTVHKSFKDRLIRIFNKEGWLNLGLNKCVHIMVVSSRIGIMKSNTEYLISILKDSFDGITSDNIESFYIASSGGYEKNNEDSLSKFNSASNSNIKIKILSGVGMINEGLHTEPEIDILINLKAEKGEYTVAQKCGRVFNQNFTHQPYFIDVACDADALDYLFFNNAQQSRLQNDKNRCGFSYDYMQYHGLNVDIFDLDDFDVLVGSEFASHKDVCMIFNRLGDYAGLLHDPDFIISRICNEFSYISEHRIREILLSCGVYSRN